MKTENDKNVATKIKKRLRDMYNIIYNTAM